MPQLDFLTYLNQYFWIIGILSLSVTIMMCTILPSVKYSLECRVVSENTLQIDNKHDFIAYKKLLFV